MNTVKAFTAGNTDSGWTRSVVDFPIDALGDGDVLVRVDYSGINFKDGLASSGTGRVARLDPLVPGVDLAGVVEEPGPRNAGAVFLWVSELREGEPTLEPRGYRLPYSKELHTRVEEGLKRGRDGVAQMGTAEPKLDKPGAGLLGLKPGNDEQELNIKDLPVPQLPEK